ncbi:hypothetical protein [Tsuneonella deserti]|uniref:hypothetical protein n=1 Tax=Tsuneonella deserti TaxID=2035528 RepID=UPI0016686FA4|nr:hypothetical protein [Tsuneonella deserti]
MIEQTSHGASASASKSARIAAVCEREITAITARLETCLDSDDRTRLLRERANIRQLLDFAVRQADCQSSTARSGQ